MITKTSVEGCNQSPVHRFGAPAFHPAASSARASITRAHQSAGNLAVQNYLRQSTLQAKLTISQPGDQYEAEADRIADSIMGTPGAGFGAIASPPPAEGNLNGVLQRKCACGDNPGGENECDACKAQQLNLQRRAKTGGSIAGAVSVHQAVGSHGYGLDSASRAFFEPRFGTDFSHVRIHADAVAAESADSVRALAYTVGRDIVFGQGQYNPHSNSGRHLLAHELTHVVQQGSGSEAATANPMVQRQTPAGGPAPQDPGAGSTDPVGPTAEPEAPGDPATTQPPPEHAERVERLQEMASEIETERQRGQELQAAIRALPKLTSPEVEPERISLKNDLTLVETDIAGRLEERIALIDEATQGLEAVLPGYTPAPPATPTTSDPTRPDASAYTVQSELYRLAKEKNQNEQDLRLLKRCIARKRVRQIVDELSNVPADAAEEREKLKQERAEQMEFLEKSVGPCTKSASETHHPTEASPGAIQMMKEGKGKSGGEGFAPTAYAAMEQEGKSGCTIGYGHVVKASDGPTCTHETTPVEPKPDAPKPDAPQPDAPQPDAPKPAAPKKTWQSKIVPCTCIPDWVLTPETANALLKRDIAIQARWIKQHVLVDLDQAHFDALIDLGLHHGSVPKSLIAVIHAKICTDDEAVRQEYLKSSLGVAGKPEKGAKFGKRREERVWASQKDEDPECL